MKYNEVAFVAAHATGLATSFAYSRKASTRVKATITSVWIACLFSMIGTAYLDYKLAQRRSASTS